MLVKYFRFLGYRNTHPLKRGRKFGRTASSITPPPLPLGISLPTLFLPNPIFSLFAQRTVDCAINDFLEVWNPTALGSAFLDECNTVLFCPLLIIGGRIDFVECSLS